MPPADWRAKWQATLAKDPDDQIPANYDDAVLLVQGLVNPPLTATTVSGKWDPVARRWV